MDLFIGSNLSNVARSSSTSAKVPAVILELQVHCECAGRANELDAELEVDSYVRRHRLPRLAGAARAGDGAGRVAEGAREGAG